MASASFLQILAPELNDRMLADFLTIESSLIVTMHIQSIDQVAAIKQVKRKITDLDKNKMDEQKKAVRAGYDMDILPSDLATYGHEAKKLLQDLQSHNERMFLVTFLILNTANTKQLLENNVFQAQSIAQKYNCAVQRLDFQQEQALVSSLPIGLNQIEIQRGLTTSSTAIFVPFTTQELFQAGGESLYYGLNALSNNLIMVDRKKLKNPKGLYCKGRSADWKTQASKPFAAQMDGKPQRRNRDRNISSALMTYSTAGTLDFHLLVKGSNPMSPISDYATKIQKSVSINVFHTNQAERLIIERNQCHASHFGG